LSASQWQTVDGSYQTDFHRRDCGESFRIHNLVRKACTCEFARHFASLAIGSTP
jgi:hypothetical protein